MRCAPNTPSSPRTLLGAGCIVAWALAILAVPAYAARVPGAPAKAACYAVFDVQGGTVSGRKVSCNAGDPTCDIGTPTANSCNFMVRYCLNDMQTAPGCTPAGLKKVNSKLSAGNITFPTQPSDSACGNYTPFTVKLKGKKKPKKNKRVIRLTAIASKGFKPPREEAHVVLVCNPGTTTSTTLPSNSCPPNSTGPSQLTVTIQPNAGADLDTGWTGTSHNFSVPGNASVTYCLSNCDANGNCTASASAGAGNTLDGKYFGPPVPLLAGGAPVCLVDRYKDTTLSGMANYKTGDLSTQLNLFSDVYITTTGHVCPSCENGHCDSGLNQGAACSPVSDIRVAATGRVYHLTSQCLPDGTPATLSVSLPITTGQSSITQADCSNLPVLCSKPQADQCHGSGCGTVCVGPTSCPSKVHDPLKPNDPTAMVCVGQNGGISQNCCSDNPDQPCFPIANGGTLTRTGLAAPPSGSPLRANEVEVGTFCIPSIPPPNCNTGDVAGLPAPGAIEWPVITTWQ
jgi:hypothetical protein